MLAPAPSERYLWILFPAPVLAHADMPLAEALAAARGAPVEQEKPGSEESSSACGPQGSAVIVVGICTHPRSFKLRSSAKKKKAKKHKKRP